MAHADAQRLTDHVGVEEYRTDVRDALLILTVLGVLLGLLVLFSIYELPNAWSCIDEPTARWTPAMAVEVTSDRAGHIVERRDFFGCSWYWYEGRG